ncbi:MAG: diaminopimelate epimerase, partial [Armatimonadetes bacterium]|nr:diaminopimelate epimerase [Armatimonadota bacterium]
VVVETGNGPLTLEQAGDGQIRVDMGPAGLTRGEIGMRGPADERFVGAPVSVGTATFSGTAVSMGNPHLVLIVDDADSIDLAELGPSLENHELFTGRTNVHFVQVLDRSRIVQRTWERGAGATLACGTGACASAVAAFLNGLTERAVDVDLPGGRLHVEYMESGHVFMTGPAVAVYDGEWALEQPLAL